MSFPSIAPAWAALICCLAFSSFAPAQNAQLLQDINTVPVTAFSAEPHGFVRFGDAVYFFAESRLGVHGLWKTDGTGGGTQVVRDRLDGENLVVSGGLLFFAADDGIAGRELWKSDGSPEGTVRVKDLFPGQGSGVNSGSLVDVAGTLFFAGVTDGNFDRALWKSDGSASGTVMVKDINPQGDLASFDGLLLFVASDGVNGFELWRSDGSPEGTEMVRDIAPGAESGGISGFLAFDDAAYFVADDGVSGSELWRTDGTMAGTVRVTDLSTGEGHSVIGPLDSDNLFNGSIYFTARSSPAGKLSLWRSDGTAEGTVLVKEDTFVRWFRSAGGVLYFIEHAVDLQDRNVSSGNALWRTDGTTEGTQIVKEFDQFNVGGLASLGETLFFVANDGVNGYELWKTNGTEGGTVLVKDINPQGNSSPGLFSADDMLLFSANDGVHGRELWRSDGSTAGTVLVKDIGVSPGSAEPQEFTRSGGSLFFTADDGLVGRELWRTDGDQSMLVKDIAAEGGSEPLDLVDLDGMLFFTADDDVNGRELWKSDGSEDGTVMVVDMRPEAGSEPQELTAINGTLYFTADDGVSGREMWRSDGTEAGTALVRDISDGGAGAEPELLTVVGSTLFFTANDGVSGRELWKSDGSEDGTTLLKDMHDASLDPNAPYFADFTSSGGLLFFRASNECCARELWRSDGTENGTIFLMEAPPQDYFVDLEDVEGTLYFADLFHLWQSKGTPETTLPIKDFGDEAVYAAGPDQFLACNHQLYFLRKRDGSSPVLWKSDGTAEGTTAIEPFAETPFPKLLSCRNGSMFLNATSVQPSGDRRYQVGRSQGGAVVREETNFVEPVMAVSAIGSQIVFGAHSEDEGNELWAMPMTPGILPTGVVDAAGFSALLAPGSLASLFGAELTGETAAAMGFPLPTSLAGVGVRVNGVDAPLLFVSPTQVNFQVPYETPVGGPASVVVVLEGEPSPSEATAVAEFAPGLFVHPETGMPIVQRHPDYALITAANPAKPGDTLILYVTGIGGLDNPPPDGTAAADSPLATATTTPVVTVGGVEAHVLFAGLTPGFAGLGQINIRVPADLPRGAPLKLTIRFGDQEGQETKLPF